MGAIVEPDVLAEGDQGGEEVTGKRPEELVELCSGRRVLDTLFVDGDAGAADLKSEGVVEGDEEGEAAFARGKSCVMQRPQCLIRVISDNRGWLAAISVSCSRAGLAACSATVNAMGCRALREDVRVTAFLKDLTRGQPPSKMTGARPPKP